jgi:hypothetical protein
MGMQPRKFNISRVGAIFPPNFDFSDGLFSRGGAEIKE